MKETNKKILSIMVIMTMLFTLYTMNIASATEQTIKELNTTSSMLSYSEDVAYEGSRSLKVTPENGGKFCQASAIGMEKGKKYDIVFYMYANPVENMGTFRFELGENWDNPNGNIIAIDKCQDLWADYNYTYHRITQTEKNGWYKFESTVPWELTFDTNVEIFQIQSAGTGFYLDNISIKEHETQTELITNGSFEEGGENPPAVTEKPDVPKDDDPPSTPPYIKEFKDTSPMLSYSSKIAYKGEQSLRVVPQEGGMFCDPTKIGMVKDRTYDIEFYMYANPVENMGIFRLQLGKNWDNPNGNVMAIENCKDLWASENYTYQKIEAVDKGWYKVSTTVPWALTGNEQGGLESIFQIQTPGQRFYIDELSIKEHSTQKELISNGGFEVNTEPTATPEPTREDNTITEFGNPTEVAGVIYSSAEAYEGEWSVHVTQPSGERGITATWGDLGINDDETYNLSFYYKGTVEGMYVRMGASQFKFENDSITKINGEGTATITDTDKAGWKKLTITGAQSANGWKTNMLYTNNTNTNFYIDNLSITDSTGKDIIKNGGFEPIEKIKRVRKNYMLVSELGNTSAIDGVVYSADESYDGNWSVRVTQPADGRGITALWGDLGINDDETYNLSFYYKGKIEDMYIRIGASQFKFNNTGIEKVNPDGAGTATITDTDKAGWKKLTITGAKSEDGWKTNMLYTNNTSTNFYMDNLSITDSTGKELIQNNSFEPPEMEFGEYEIKDNGDGTKTVTINVVNHSAGENASAQLIVAAYDNDYRMNSCEYNDNPSQIPQTDMWIPLTQTIKVNDGENMIAYLWDTLDNMVPLVPAEPLMPQ